MKQILSWLLIFISVWLIISSLFLGYSGVGTLYIILTGIVIFIISLKFALSSASKAIWPYWINVVLGTALIIYGLWGIIVGGGFAHINEIIFGVLITLLSYIITQIVEGAASYMYTKDGNVLMEAKSVEFRDKSLVLRGKIMGTMPTSAYLHPEEAWAMLGILTQQVILTMPSYLFHGWKNRAKLLKRVKK
jgi:hypothetical protein